ncbi:hypothetical protein I3271_09375 [Photobacterium leiognathi]|uniref:DnaB-like helicase N-terminal domain-containing protein n=1 Tax=Photobacterium leiognathi TaxID=553611 RepID=UPI001EE0498F|nr:DnaB-like helicase N-terminal domain-containing protein [Photobacterium leiognathi]MCG3884897.1 hypothetical protein [Photobacterium leiognathi]
MCDLKNTEIEDIFLATIFNKLEWLEYVLLDNKLTDSVFSCPVNRSVYKVIQDLAAKGRAVDLTILYHELDVDEDDDSYEFLDEWVITVIVRY